MNGTPKATLLDAYERLAARDAGGGMPEHELESEKERLLAESEGPQVAERYRYERLYRAADYAGTLRLRVLLAVVVLSAMGAALAIAAWLLGGI